MSKHAIILAAGRGSRLDPGRGSVEFSKPLVRLAGKSLLERAVEACRKAGAERITVVTGFRAELVTAEAQRLDRGDVDTVFNEEWKKSNGVSLLVCKPQVSGNFALMMSDHVFEPSILRDLYALEPAADSVTLAVDTKLDQVYDMDDATKVRIEDGRIVSIAKSLPRFNAVDCGLFLCTPAILTALQGVYDREGDCSLSQGMAQIGHNGRFFPFDIGERRWQDVDTPSMASEALRLAELLDGPPPPRAKAS